MHTEYLNAYIYPVLLIAACLLATACATGVNITSEWAQKVESGEYGWIDFNTGDTKNLDGYPQEQIDHLKGSLYPNYTQRCFEQLRDYGSGVTADIQFLISPQGHIQQFEIVSSRARECARNVIEALSTFSFSGATRNGNPVTAVGSYSVDLPSASSGYGN